MCDCVPATPLSYSGTRIRKLGFARCNSKARVCRTQLLCKVDYGFFLEPSIVYNSARECFRNGGIQFIRGGLNRNEGEVNMLKAKNCIKENRNYGALGAENYGLYDQLGFMDRDKENFEFETQMPTSLNPTVESVLDFSDGEKEEKQSSKESVSSSFDFLELKSDLEKENGRGRHLGSVDDEDLVQIEGSHGVDSKSKQLIGRPGLKSRRQLIRRSNMLAKQVISVQSALSMGFVSQLWVDTSSWMVLVVEVRPSLLSGEMERFLLEDVHQVGDVVLVQDENLFENEYKMIDLDTLVGYNVVTPNRRNIGKVRGYTFNINSGAVELLELDSFGISVIPSSLVSTYGLFVEDVLEVAFDTVVVHEAAASRVQRLTKGFLNTRNVGTFNDEFREYSDLERPDRFNHGRRSRKSSSSRKFPSEFSQTGDNWELPMDYL